MKRTRHSLYCYRVRSRSRRTQHKYQVRLGRQLVARMPLTILSVMRGEISFAVMRVRLMSSVKSPCSSL